MGYYFKKAKSRKDLSPEQLERYNMFRSHDSTLPILQELHDRIEFIKEYVGPITSGEIWSALEELVQDAFVTWILAGEDPQEVQWTHPDDLATPPPPPPTEEERKKSQEWWENFQRKHRERLERDKREDEKWERANRPILHFLRKTVSFFRRES